MHSSLIGNFDFVELIHHIYAMYGRFSSSMRFVSFRTLFSNDPCTLPSPTISCEGKSHIGMTIPLLVIKIVYQDILDSNVDLILYPRRQTRMILFSSLYGLLHRLAHMIASMIL
jgi:hypothetical protein